MVTPPEAESAAGKGNTANFRGGRQQDEPPLGPICGDDLDPLQERLR